MRQVWIAVLVLSLLGALAGWLLLPPASALVVAIVTGFAALVAIHSLRRP